MSAIVCTVTRIEKHPGADRLELVSVVWPTSSVKIENRPGEWIEGHFTFEERTVVTGCHYRVGQRGLFIPAGSVIPGWLAEDMWLVGHGKSKDPYEVKQKPIRGIESIGLFYGEYYRKDTSDLRSVQRFEKLEAEGGKHLEWPDSEGWIRSPYWRDWWEDGQDVAPLLGVGA